MIVHKVTIENVVNNLDYIIYSLFTMGICSQLYQLCFVYFRYLEDHPEWFGASHYKDNPDSLSDADH